MKVPQILKIVQSKSAVGVSLSSAVMEHVMFLFSLAYNVALGNPFRCVCPAPPPAACRRPALSRGWHDLTALFLAAWHAHSTYGETAFIFVQCLFVVVAIMMYSGKGALVLPYVLVSTAATVYLHLGKQRGMAYVACLARRANHTARGTHAVVCGPPRQTSCPLTSSRGWWSWVSPHQP